MNKLKNKDKEKSIVNISKKVMGIDDKVSLLCIEAFIEGLNSQAEIKKISQDNKTIPKLKVG